MLMVKLFARSSTALSSVRFQHIHAGFMNRLLDIFANPVSSIKSLPNIFALSSQPTTPLPDNSVPYMDADACCQGTGPPCPIPIALFPFY